MATKKQDTTTVIRKPKDEKFRVIPGRSLNGRDIRNRVNNRTLIPGLNLEAQYTLDEKFSQMKRMSKIDIAREYIKEVKDIQDMKNKLEKNEQENASKIKAAKEKEVQELKDFKTKHENEQPKPKT